MLHGLRLGEYGAVEPQECLFNQKFDHRDRMWQGALSWWSIQLLAILGRSSQNQMDPGMV
jgi:hypothetical protein